MPVCANKFITYKKILKWSGRRDLNPRLPAPKAGALAELRHSPINNISAFLNVLLLSP